MAGVTGLVMFNVLVDLTPLMARGNKTNIPIPNPKRRIIQNAP